MAKLAWFDMWSKDFDGTKKFFEDMFGYKMTAMEGMDNYAVMTDGEDQVGGIGPVDDNMPVATIPYFPVENVDSAVEKAQGLGCQVLVPVSPIPGGGRFAIFLSPQGDTVGVAGG